MKTVIIGAGGIAYAHARALEELGVTIEGVYDIRRENAEKLAAQFHSRAIESVSDVLGRVDMAHLFTPPSERVTYAKQVLEAGLPLYIEKPIAASLADAQQIVDCAGRNRSKLIVGFNHRYREGYKMLWDAVKSGELGEPVNVFSHRLGAGSGFRGQSLSASWRTDPKLVCGMSVESLSHDINMLLPLCTPVESVSANLFGTVASLPAFDNNSNVTFRLNGGGVGLIHASWSSDIPYSARGYIGSRGTAILRGNGLWDFDEFVIRTADMPYEKIIRVGEDFRTTAHASYVAIHRHFLECIVQDREPLTGGQDGVDALRFALAILESNETGRAVSWTKGA